MFKKESLTPLTWSSIAYLATTSQSGYINRSPGCVPCPAKGNFLGMIRDTAYLNH